MSILVCLVNDVHCLDMCQMTPCCTLVQNTSHPLIIVCLLSAACSPRLLFLVLSLSLSVGLIARMSNSSQGMDLGMRLVRLYVTLTFSFLGFVATFVFYILTAKCTCCKQCSCPEESLLEKCCGAISCTERD